MRHGPGRHTDAGTRQMDGWGDGRGEVKKDAGNPQKRATAEKGRLEIKVSLVLA